MTVVALANGNHKTVQISSIEKRKLIEAVIELENPRKNYRQKIFSALIFLLLESSHVDEVLIDKEYEGHESVIKDTLIYLTKKTSKKLPIINFGYVGKKCNAHHFAIETFRKNIKPDLIIKAKDVLKILYGEKEKRLEVSV